MSDIRTFVLTQFPDVRTTTGKQIELSLSQLAELLTATPRVNTGDKTDSPCFTPGSFRDQTRSKANFLKASCLCLDFDGQNHGALSDGELLSILEELNDRRLSHVVYTTYNAGLRVVLPLADDVTREQYTALHDHASTWFKDCPPDKTGKTAERLHFLPQVSSDEAAARHMSEFVDAGALLSLDVLTPVFAALRLSEVKVGAQARCESFADLTRILAASEKKQEDLNRYVFALAKGAAARGVDPDQFKQAVGLAAEKGLTQNPVPVKDWDLAEATVIRAVDAAYRQHADELLKSQEAGPTYLPAPITKRVQKLIQAGKLEDAGAVVGPYVSEELTVDMLVEAAEEIAEHDSSKIISIPDALAAFREGIERATGHDWKQDLEVDKDGRYCASDENCLRVLTQHPQCRALFANNVRTDTHAWYKHDAPWGTPAGEPPASECAPVSKWLCDQLGVASVGFNRADAAWRHALARAESYDPALEWLESLTWDGQPRLDTWLNDFCGAEDSPYTRLVGRKWLLGAVARAFSPGCKVENVLVLCGSQGAGKSRTAYALVPRPEWFGTIAAELSEKETAMNMSQWMIAECEEIDRWSNKKQAAEFKAFVSERTRRVRPAYAKDQINFPRRAVLIGTTNREDFLHDDTGARRWWPVAVGECNVPGLEAVRDQLWAEAVAAYVSGEVCWLTPDEIKITKPQQEVLVIEEGTPESDALLEAMNHLPPSQRCPLNTPPDSRNGRVWIVDGQMDGDKMLWVTRAQAAAILTRAGFRNDEKTVKRALKVARLKRNKSNDRYYLDV